MTTAIDNDAEHKAPVETPQPSTTDNDQRPPRYKGRHRNHERKN